MDIQRKLIGYGGVTQDGNDYASKDGELAVCQGAVNEDGGLRKVVQGTDIGLDLESGECVYLHRNVGMGKHYIVLREDATSTPNHWVLDWYEYNSSTHQWEHSVNPFLTFDEGEVYADAAAIGNMLIVTTDTKKYYCLWKDSAYTFLGNDLPEINIRFTTQGYFGSDGALARDKGNVLVEGDTISTEGSGKYTTSREVLMSRFLERSEEAEWDSLTCNLRSYVNWPENNWPDTEVAFVKPDETAYGDGKNYPQILTDKCFDLLNDIIKEAKEQGLMVMPRLVRAAWRLYDGTYAKFTTPVLVFNSGTRHLTAIEGEDVEDGDKEVGAKIYPYTIDYFIENTLSGVSGLKAKWGDLIKGITFFSSSEVYDYDQQGKITTLRKTFYTTRQGQSNKYDTHFYVELPRPSEDDQLNQLRSGSPFYEIFDKDLEEATNRYILLQYKRVFEKNGNIVKIKGRNTSFTISTGTSADVFEVQYSISDGDTFENIAKNVGEAVRGVGLKARVYKMCEPKVRVNGKIYSREMCLAIVPQKDYDNFSLAVLADDANDDPDDSEGTHEDSLDIIGVNCWGNPLPSDRLPLKTLETQQHINDDYLQHVDILPRVMDAYNNRLNMGNLQVLFREYKPAWNTPAWYNGGVDSAPIRSASGYAVKKIWYYIKTSGSDKIVSYEETAIPQASPNEDEEGRNAILHYLYYPDKRCYKAVLECCLGGQNNTSFYLQFFMKPSNMLNGAVFVEKIPYWRVIADSSIVTNRSYFQERESSSPYSSGDIVYYRNRFWEFNHSHYGNWNYDHVDLLGTGYKFNNAFYNDLNSYKIASFTAPAEGVNAGVEELKNVVLTTMVDNPLNWEAKGESSVGNGEILALAPNTRALSEGQFGQHPMYAFTTDEGVWAMQIGSDGQMTAVQAVTRDTLTDKKSILQLDTSILFGTERGIMELAGSSSACMTDRLTGKGFDITKLSGYATLLEAAGLEVGDLPSDSVDFRQFVRGCRMAYDYVNQHIYVWNPETLYDTEEEEETRKYGYAYVYSIKGKSWGVIGCTLKEPLNTYPEALVTTDDRTVVKLGATTDPSAASSTSPNLGAEQNVGKVLVVTRPLKVDSLDGLKTLYEVWQRGMIRPADSEHWVKQALYGSRDMYNWRLVGSSTSARMPNLGGSPYKYYRVAVVASMGDDEFIEGCEIRWRDKYNKSLR